jgi:DNA-binding response OmpR family regulator
VAETILVVDDEELNRELLFHVLNDDGYQICLAPDGPTAIALANESPPDLILLDLMMPGMHGLEVCRRLKAATATAEIPIIVVTAAGQIADKEAVLTSGADDFVSKPVDAGNLRARVSAMLRARRAHQELDRILAYVQELEADQLRERQVALAKALGAPWPQLPRDSKGIPVLFVSDRPSTLSVYPGLLAEHGFDVSVAQSGTQAVDLLQRTGAETVLLDVHITDMSWLEVMQRIRQKDPDVPVIILTSQPTAARTLAALKAGAVDFIAKGWDHSLVALTVHRTVCHYRQLQSAQEEVRQLRARLQELQPAGGKPTR